MIIKDLNIEKCPLDDWSEVFDYREDISKLKDAVGKIVKGKKNVISVGNGGSITSFDAYSHALGKTDDCVSVWTMDPFFLNKIKSKFSPEDTVVVAVSKSGNTLGQIEALLYFQEFPIICVTNPNEGTLQEMAKKMGWEIIEHPPVGGRFSGGTSSTLVPALICGMDIESIQEGLIEGYSLKDEAYTLSKMYFENETKGYNEVYVTCYAEALAGFENLIVQLMHESACKDGKGQTFYFAMGPEAQHHTNQRFIGGKNNVIGTFIVESPVAGEKINVPEGIKSISYKGGDLGIIDNLDYSKALYAEYLGTKGDADEKSIPNVTIEVDKIDEKNIGKMVAFWHLVAFYSSLLRDVNPFDQPAVERSKNITLGIIQEGI